MRLAAALLVSALLAVLLAGCGSRPPTAECFTPARPIEIPAFLAERDGDRVLWHVRVANVDCVAQHDLELRLWVRYATLAAPGAGQEESAQLAIGTLSAGQTSSYTLATAYHGDGDYSGPVEVYQGGARVARNAVFFEECPGAC